MINFEPLYSMAKPATVARFIEKQYALGASVSCRLLQRGLNNVY